MSIPGLPRPACGDDTEEAPSLHISSPETSLPSGTASPVAPDFSPLTVETLSQLSTSSSSSRVSDHMESATATATVPCYPTMKIVGDNIDKYQKPREMRVDAQATMPHYFNMYAVRDWIDASKLEDEPSLPDPTTINLDVLFPTPQDHREIHSNFQHLVARVLNKYMPYFGKFGSGLERHL